MNKLVIFSFFFFFTKSVVIAQGTLDTLESFAHQFNDTQWEEIGYNTEWVRPRDSASAELIKKVIEEDGNIRDLNMVRFTYLEKSKEGIWAIFYYPFKIIDKLKGTKSFPAQAPFRGKIGLNGTRIFINFYQIDQIDEILFFDKNNLLIRHCSPEKIEVVAYKRY